MNGNSPMSTCASGVPLSCCGCCCCDCWVGASRRTSTSSNSSNLCMLTWASTDRGTNCTRKRLSVATDTAISPSMPFSAPCDESKLSKWMSTPSCAYRPRTWLSTRAAVGGEMRERWGVSSSPVADQREEGSCFTHREPPSKVQRFMYAHVRTDAHSTHAYTAHTCMHTPACIHLQTCAYTCIHTHAYTCIQHKNTSHTSDTRVHTHVYTYKRFWERICWKS
jgi:hypothetical protein